MAVSTATVTPTNMELTPMRVTFNGTDLGGTLSNVVISMKYNKSPIKADQYGDTILDQRVSGQEFLVTTELAETELAANWKVVFPQSNLVTSGGNKQNYFDMRIGDGDLARSAILILHPLSRANADLSGDFKFFKATATGESEVTYSPTGQAKLKIVWRVYPDTSATPAKFFVHGDPAIGLTAASASAASFSGTGNGTMGSITVYSGFTVSEVVTATCVTAAANAGTFNVNGSITGPMGLATVGVSFVPANSRISFTIADGSTDFIVGDAFTVTTVAANYV